MEQFDLLNSIPGGDAQQLLSDTIAKAASSAALAAVRSVLSDGKPKKKKTGGVLKFSNRELNSMSDKLKNYYIQSAYDIPTEEKRLQEARSFDKVGDSFKKIIVIERNIKPRRDEKGYLTIGIRDFLLDGNSLDL